MLVNPNEVVFPRHMVVVEKEVDKKTKIFYEDAFGLFSTLTEKVNCWVRENKGKINILSIVYGIKQGKRREGYKRSATVLYTE